MTKNRYLCNNNIPPSPVYLAVLLHSLNSLNVLIRLLYRKNIAQNLAWPTMIRIFLKYCTAQMNAFSQWTTILDKVEKVANILRGCRKKICPPNFCPIRLPLTSQDQNWQKKTQRAKIEGLSLIIISSL